MKIEIRNGPHSVQVIEATSVLVYDNYGNPVCVTMELSPNRLTTTRLKDPDFKEKLHQLGVHRVVKVNEITSGQGRISI